ncbi:hypothetical protein GCM10011352_10610 [Marinobacterium zhoushanense]|uniref:Uncharacterized protein n=1 Tax=Marinobacterium zhoushanense TaxID=1679163 RepID=A0ABQ1K7B4_9GAMM|nr:hypothetical protein [Marinobacterium zhoushanense]GGB86594.1 hypothetical protein GCM10011352_10610 [Marinobacterium zhoushanense]
MNVLLKTSLIASLFSLVFAPLAIAGNGAPSGAHYTVNFIGHPNLAECDGDPEYCESILGGNAAYSGGSALFVPLVTSKSPGNGKSGKTTLCTDPDDGLQTEFIDEEGPTFQTEEPDGKTRIYFEPTTDGSFEIVDRIADKDGATIQVPVTDDANRYIMLDLFIRVLGKPGTCAEITGYAEETVDTTQLWWYSGSILLDRESGRSTFEKATDIFSVAYCEVEWVDTDGDLAGDTWQCVDGSETELSVFNDIFDQYFWEFLNNGTRLIQARFYPRSDYPG